jgi:hypothetical protein
MRRLLCLLVAAALLPAAPAAAAPEEAIGVDEQAIVAPQAEPEDTPTATPTPTPTPAETPPSGEDGGPPTTASPEPLVEQGHGNNAAAQQTREKEREAERHCAASTSSLLAKSGSQIVDDDRSWAWLPLLIAAIGAALAIGAYAVRRRRAPRQDETPPSTLEVASALVAICAGVAGLAVQFVPGIGADEAPAPRATMEVRAVDARITRQEYAERLGLAQDEKELNRREVGNVIWLQIHLKGYRGRALVLSYGSYETKPGAPLVASTTRTAPITVSDDSDEQTRFQPIWVGYPSLKRFHVQFQLLENEAVREIAKTGPMRGDRARYACKADR